MQILKYVSSSVVFALIVFFSVWGWSVAVWLTEPFTGWPSTTALLVVLGLYLPFLTWGGWRFYRRFVCPPPFVNRP